VPRRADALAPATAASARAATTGSPSRASALDHLLALLRVLTQLVKSKGTRRSRRRIAVYPRWSVLKNGSPPSSSGGRPIAETERERRTSPARAASPSTRREIHDIRVSEVGVDQVGRPCWPRRSRSILPCLTWRSSAAGPWRGTYTLGSNHQLRAFITVSRRSRVVAVVEMIAPSFNPLDLRRPLSHSGYQGSMGTTGDLW